jgi:malate permease and related proteins
LGRALYWVGVPVEILSLARRTNFSESTSLAIAVTVATLTTVTALACVSLLVGNRTRKTYDLGGRATLSRQFYPIVNAGQHRLYWVSDRSLGLVVFYSITQNIVGTYGLGVCLASYFGRSSQENRWWTQIRDVLCVPSLWAFILGLLTQRVELPNSLEFGLQASIGFMIPTAFLLMGIRLGQI